MEFKAFKSKKSGVTFLVSRTTGVALCLDDGELYHSEINERDMAFAVKAGRYEAIGIMKITLSKVIE